MCGFSQWCKWAYLGFSSASLLPFPIDLPGLPSSSSLCMLSDDLHRARATLQLSHTVPATVYGPRFLGPEDLPWLAPDAPVTLLCLCPRPPGPSIGDECKGGRGRDCPLSIP